MTQEQVLQALFTKEQIDRIDTPMIWYFYKNNNALNIGRLDNTVVFSGYDSEIKHYSIVNNHANEIARFTVTKWHNNKSVNNK